MIFHPRKSNYKRESLAFYPCKAFSFHRLSVSRSDCLFLLRTKRRCGRRSRGRPPGPGSSYWSGGSGWKSGRGKEGLSPAVSGLPGEYRREVSRSAGRPPPAVRHIAKNRNVSRRSGNLKIIKTKIKLASALFGSVADPIGKKGRTAPERSMTHSSAPPMDAGPFPRGGSANDRQKKEPTPVALTAAFAAILTMYLSPSRFHAERRLRRRSPIHPAAGRTEMQHSKPSYVKDKRGRHPKRASGRRACPRASTDVRSVRSSCLRTQNRMLQTTHPI